MVRHRNGFESAIVHPSAKRFEFEPAAPRVIDKGDSIEVDVDNDGDADVFHFPATGETVIDFGRPIPPGTLLPTVTVHHGDHRFTAYLDQMDECRCRLNVMPLPLDRQRSVSRLFGPADEQRVELDMATKVFVYQMPM